VLAASAYRLLPRTPQDPLRQLCTRSTLLTAAVNFFWTVGTALAMIAPVLGLIWAGPPTKAQAPEGPPGSGIILSTEFTAIRMPRALRDLARQQTGPPVDQSREELQTYLRRNGWSAAWYALTYRGHQVNGGYAEITQIRRLSEAADHLDELQVVMATAAGKPPRFECGDYLHARLEVIPESLQAVDPRETITRLMAEPVVGEKSSLPGAPDCARRTE
jgi:hypothetical protein